ncbi:MAG: polysaccharide export protein [Pseudomonadales bacterium]|nr:polysaccharide export protein [Pseudomonadales bacterium]MBO6595972.1 polysaccharide export protein [Pseudomonadales bacterium]MBO6822455.1 polysaccharide export protein [Pseudomonadales bacterium]
MARAAIFVLLSISFVTLAADESSYRLGSGDLISITVFDEPELSMEVRVGDRPISYPFLGQVELRDRPIARIEEEITEGLRGDYLIEPRVSISVKEYRPFFISGEVEKPGGYAYQPGLTLRQAISLGGGLTERASRNKMFVTRDGRGEEIRLEMGDPVFPDDVINIEQSFF